MSSTVISLLVRLPLILCARHKSTLRKKTKDQKVWLSAIDGNDKLMKSLSSTKGARLEAMCHIKTAVKFEPKKVQVSRQDKPKDYVR